MPLFHRPRRTEDAALRIRLANSPQSLLSPLRLLAALVLGTAVVATPIALPRPTSAQPVAAQFAVLGVTGSADRAFTVPTETAITGTTIYGAPQTTSLRVKVAVANLRAEPRTSARRVARLARGTTLKLLKREGNWYQVRTSGGKTGWISVTLVSNTATPSRQTTASSPLATITIPDNEGTEFGRTIAQLALPLVGRAYRYGGAGPNAFDCSGLTSYVYRQAGISIPRSSRAQYAMGGQRISNMADLQPGDLVFFANTARRGISHAAIYVGGGQMVTANTPRQGVQLSRITDRYWRSHWAGGLRLGQ